MGLFTTLCRAASALLMCGALYSLPAAASERAYFKSVEGQWSGAGRIAAGPYKDTRFTCNFSGETPDRLGMVLNGTCRVGVFPQAMSAKIYKQGGTYRGRFTLGSKGDGLDITSGKLRGKRLTLGIKHKKLRGTFMANLKSPDSLNLTIAVRVQKKLIPFIGLTLSRTGKARKTSLLVSE